MKKICYLLLLTPLFYSCNKLKDYLPLPPSSQFNKLYGGSDIDRAASVTATLDGGYITAGVTYSNNGDVSGYHGGIDAWVVKVDKQGRIQWQKALGGSGHDEARSIISTLDGGYIMAGVTNSNDGDVNGKHQGQSFSGRENEDAWVVKLDKDGNLLWQKPLGGSLDDDAYSIIATADGYIMAGSAGSNDGDVSGNHGVWDGGFNKGYDAWVVKLDKAGNKIWQKALGGANDEQALSVTATTDGYFMAGYTFSLDGDVSGNHGGWFDAWVVKLDATGNKVWQRSLGGSDIETARSVAATLDGGCIMAGEASSNDGDVSGLHGNTTNYSDGWVVKLDKEGVIQWQKALGGSTRDVLNSVAVTGDGYILSGFTDSNDGDVSGYKDGNDAWVVKLNNNGSKLWQKTIGGLGAESSSSIIVTPSGYVMAGLTNSNDGDVSGNHGNDDAWLLTLQDK